jgi:hypothetical protein
MERVAIPMATMEQSTLAVVVALYDISPQSILRLMLAERAVLALLFSKFQTLTLRASRLV